MMNIVIEIIKLVVMVVGSSAVAVVVGPFPFEKEQSVAPPFLLLLLGRIVDDHLLGGGEGVMVIF